MDTSMFNKTPNQDRPSAESIFLGSPEKEPEFSIRALSPDNHYDAEKVVELFHRQHGETYPFVKVYDPLFWCTSLDQDQSQTDRTSIVAVHDGKIVAHWALLHRGQSDFIEILYPAIDPAYRAKEEVLNELFWSRMDEYARRQGWHYVIQYIAAGDTYAEHIATEYFHTISGAIIPPALSQRDELVSSVPLLMRYRILKQREQLKLRVFTPARYENIVRRVLSQVPGEREYFLTHSGEPREAFKSSSKELTASYELQELPRFGLLRLKIRPSMVSNEFELQKLIDSTDADATKNHKRFCIYIAADDPYSLEFISTIEKQGYNFFGVLPRVHEHDYLVFSKFDPYRLKDIPIHDDQAEALRDALVDIASK